MSLKELRQQLSAKKAAGAAKLNEFNALGAKADRSAEDDGRLAALDGELDALETEVVDLEARIEADEKRKRQGAMFASSAITVPARAAARTVNEPNPETTFGFRSLSEFAVAVRAQLTGQGQDQRLNAAASNYMSNQGSAGEGFLTPPEFSATVWELAFEQTDLLGMTNPEPTQSNSVVKPKDETTPWGAVGVQAQWRTGGSQMTPSKLQLGGELMPLHELYAFCAATQEVLSDAPMLQDRLTRKAAQAIRWVASDAIMWGNGVGQPTGFMNAPALITVAKDGSQSTGTLSVNNLLTMDSRLLRIGGGRRIWLANSAVLPQLGQLSIGNIPAFLPNNRPLAGDPFEGTLLGKPILFTEHAQDLSALGDIVLIDLDGYYSVTKEGAGGGVDFASSIHLYFDQNLTAFRWTFRLNGQPYLSKAITPPKATTKTKSHFVALQAR